MLDDLITMIFIDMLPKPIRIGCYALMVLFLAAILIAWLAGKL